MDSVPILEVVKKVELEIKNFKPSIIFTHFENDLNIVEILLYILE